MYNHFAQNDLSLYDLSKHMVRSNIYDFIIALTKIIFFLRETTVTLGLPGILLIEKKRYKYNYKQLQTQGLELQREEQKPKLT